MNPERSLDRYVGLLAERGVRLVDGVGTAGDAWTAWRTFCDAALEPADEPFERAGETFRLAGDSDMLLHESGLTDGQPSRGAYDPHDPRLPVFSIELRRQFELEVGEGELADYGGMEALDLVIEFDNDATRLAARDQIWGNAGPRRDDSAESVAEWAAAVEASDSFRAFELLTLRRFTVSYTDI